MAAEALVVKAGKLEAIDIEVGSFEWLEWLEVNSSFRYQSMTEGVIYTARKEKAKTGKAEYWSAYRRVEGKLHKRYIGKDADLTIEKLDEIAQSLVIAQSDVTLAKSKKTLADYKAEVARLEIENQRLYEELQTVKGECYA
ncbi:hypothetical protein [Nostoc sp. MG11]|uniref:hypothetical protein n=1 Tax=Nostoc sp. MG11 TaxID=2721166 RepID=UPI001867DF34|nr:hypothetical protein [Nostoc sp. MG11]